ncbi:cytidine deaminase [Sphingomonas naphthae]|uniref:Cytidine deaminase n=1 Tax=Sphingomonas naphthae TaxID=1813468 RepID=A0ABY7TQ48_9SPHN|nr:cytidine deaminase [Sphingomonas naphthae]WCT75253.1 cytidine deaminase [Sphingomonas naphthae]
MVEVDLNHMAGRVLIDHAREAAANAHAPYSKFAVGAALLMADGSIVTGTNFENASYGLSLCAETVALASANVQGKLREVVAIGIIGGVMDGRGGITGHDPIRPCGRCRQILNEAASLAGRDLPVHCGSADGEVVEHHMLSALLPYAFGPGDLGIG